MDETTKHNLRTALDDLARASREFGYALDSSSLALRDGDFKREAIDASDARWKGYLDQAQQHMANLRRVWAGSRRTLRAAGWPKESK